MSALNDAALRRSQEVGEPLARRFLVHVERAAVADRLERFTECCYTMDFVKLGDLTSRAKTMPPDALWRGFVEWGLKLTPAHLDAIARVLRADHQVFVAFMGAMVAYADALKEVSAS